MAPLNPMDKCALAAYFQDPFPSLVQNNMPQSRSPLSLRLDSSLNIPTAYYPRTTLHGAFLTTGLDENSFPPKVTAMGTT